MVARLRSWAGVQPPHPEDEALFRAKVTDSHRRVDDVDQRLQALQQRLDVLRRK